MHGQYDLPKTVMQSSVAAVAGPRQLPQGVVEVIPRGFLGKLSISFPIWPSMSQR